MQTRLSMRPFPTLVLWLSSLVLGAQPVWAENPAIEAIPTSQAIFTEFLKIKELPRVDIAKSGRGLYRIEHDALIEELKQVSGSDPEVFARDTYYHVPTEHSARNLIKWFETLLLEYNDDYRQESWDCDDYSLALTTFGEIAAGHDHDLSHGFAWATMIVKQVNRWGRVGAGVTHELVLIHTDKGFMVVEPQNGTHARLADYPNREYIRSVFFN